MIRSPFTQKNLVLGIQREGELNLPDIGGNEKGDSRAETISLLKELIKADNNDTGKEKLEDDQNGISNTKLSNGTIHSRKNIRNSLTNGNQNT